jgi:hypothetical protein
MSLMQRPPLFMTSELIYQYILYDKNPLFMTSELDLLIHLVYPYL